MKQQLCHLTLIFNIEMDNHIGRRETEYVGKKTQECPMGITPAIGHILSLYDLEWGIFYLCKDHAVSTPLLGHVKGAVCGGHKFVHILSAAPCSEAYTYRNINAHPVKIKGLGLNII